MISLHVDRHASLDYHGVMAVSQLGQRCLKEAPVIKVLLKQSGSSGLEELLHSELEFLSSESVEIERGRLDPKKIFSDDRQLKYQVLVLIAPYGELNSDEFQAIGDLVEAGGSLLIATDRDNQYGEENAKNSQEMNNFLKKFQFRFKPLFSYPSDEIEQFEPHYLTSEVRKCFFESPVQIEVLKHEQSKSLLCPPIVVARLPHTLSPALVAVEVQGGGRVVAVSDVAIFGDYLQYGSNQQLVLNIFRWLATQNSIDCFEASIKDKDVKYGETTVFSIKLNNPLSKRLEFISCILESNAGLEIVESQEQIIRTLSPYGECQVQWEIKPTSLGEHSLRLTIDHLKTSELKPLFFDEIATLQCIPDLKIDLGIQNSHSSVPELLEVGKAIEIRAISRTSTSELNSSVSLILEVTPAILLVENLFSDGGNYCWHVVPQLAGTATISILVEETRQKISSRLVQVKPSIELQIRDIEKQVVYPLQNEIFSILKRLDCQIDTNNIQNIQFQICTPEDFVQQVYPVSLHDELFEVLDVARNEKDRNNRSLVKRLLSYVAPTFIPCSENGGRCYIPYDPLLAAHLSYLYPPYKINLSQSLLCIESSDSTELEQNVAALILHEQFGHGLFFTHTVLGRQLSILEKYGMTRSADLAAMKSPYLRGLYTEYENVINALWDSAIVVNEGFAAWLELAILPLLSGKAGQMAEQRRNFLFNGNDSLHQLTQKSEYLREVQFIHKSKYRVGCEIFQWIQELCGEDQGIPATIDAMIACADIDFGILEDTQAPRFSLPVNQMKSLLVPEQHSSDAHRRLHEIHSKLAKLQASGQKDCKNPVDARNFRLKSTDVQAILTEM